MKLPKPTGDFHTFNGIKLFLFYFHRKGMLKYCFKQYCTLSEMEDLVDKFAGKEIVYKMSNFGESSLKTNKLTIYFYNTEDLVEYKLLQNY